MDTVIRQRRVSASGNMGRPPLECLSEPCDTTNYPLTTFGRVLPREALSNV